MSERLVRSVAMASLLVLQATFSVAQPSSRGVALEGGAGLAHQDGATGTTYTTYVTAPGGTTFGWSAGIGVPVVRSLEALVELSSTGRMSATEPSRYFTTYEEERRDRTLMVGVRYSMDLGRYVAVEPSVGIGFTFAHAWSRAVYTDPVALRPPQPRVRHQLDTGIGPSFGVDLRLGSEHLAIVPSARLIRTAVSSGRYDESTTSPDVEIGSIYPGGYPEWTQRADIKLRLRF